MILKTLKSLEAQLVRLAPGLDAKSFFNRTESDNSAAQVLTIVRMAITELTEAPQSDTEEYCLLVIKENREKVEALVDEFTASDTERDPLIIKE